MKNKSFFYLQSFVIDYWKFIRLMEANAINSWKTNYIGGNKFQNWKGLKVFFLKIIKINLCGFLNFLDDKNYIFYYFLLLNFPFLSWLVFKALIKVPGISIKKNSSKLNIIHENLSSMTENNPKQIYLNWCMTK